MESVGQSKNKNVKKADTANFSDAKTNSASKQNKKISNKKKSKPATKQIKNNEAEEIKIIESQQNPELIIKADAEIKTEEIVEENLAEQQNLNSEQEVELKPDEKSGDGSDSEAKIEVELSEEIVEEKMKLAMETQTPKKKKKSIIINLCLLLVNIVFMVFIIKNFLGEVETLDISQLIQAQGKRLWWLVGGVFAYIVFILLQTLMYKVLIKGITGKNHWALSYDVGVVGKYYDNVTPFAVGGQPMQIVRLAKKGISPGVATSIPLIKMVTTNTMNMLMTLAFFIFGLPRIPLSSPLNNILLLIVEILGVIGLIVTVLVVVFMFLVSSGSLFTRSFISGICRLGYKLKIVKNYRKSFKKFLNQVAEYKSSMSFLKTHKKVLFKMIVMSFVESIIYASLAYFVVMAFATPEALSGTEPFMFLLICLTKYYLCAMASCYIPLPGGTGLMEISFIILFWQDVGNNIVWALLIWRFLSYYFILIHGFINELTQIFINISKNGKKKKQQALKESNE